MSNENNNLSLYGWSDNLFRQKQISQFKDMSHGRIIVTHKTCYEVVAEDGVYLCELTGNMIYGRMPDVQSPNQKIPDRKTKCVIKTHINIKQNVIFSAKLKPV